MKRWTQALLGLSLAASIAACAGARSNEANPAARDSGAVGTTGATADRDFIQDQLEDATAEINLSQLAAERTADPQVKDFAERLVREHQAAADELKKAAASANVAVEPPEPDSDHKNAQEELSKLTGKEFDRRYLETMIKEHEEAVNELTPADAESAEVREWVAMTLPKVRQHLEMAKQIKERLEQTGNVE
jgi:putative membrane protein